MNGALLAATWCSGTVDAVTQIFTTGDPNALVRIHVPSVDQVMCFLSRQQLSFDSDESEFELIEGEFGEVYETDEDETYAEYDDADDEDDEEGGEYVIESDDELWYIASMFGICRFAPSWWLEPAGDHGDECECRPISLLEVLQDRIPAERRQDALEAHLGALRDIWDHFWSGDALVTGASLSINGACPSCIVEGREHLGDVVDEARNLAEGLGEALAAFHSRIDIGLGRY